MENPLDSPCWTHNSTDRCDKVPLRKGQKSGTVTNMLTDKKNQVQGSIKLKELFIP